MKKRIHINFKLIVIILMLLIGGYLLISGANDLSDCEDAVSFAELKKSDIKDGTYVCGYIEKFVVRSEIVNDIEVRDAVSQTFIEFSGESDVYTIPFDTDNYILLMASSDDIKKGLNNMLQSSSDKVYFEGVIEKKDIEVNEAWYGPVNEDDYPGINHIISDYYICEVEKEDFWNSIRWGAILAVIAILLFVDGGGFDSLIEREEIGLEVEEESMSLKDIDNKEEELISKESLLRQLTRKQKRIIKKKPSSIIMMVLGVLSLIILPKIFIVGIILLAFGGKGIFEWYINSSNLNGIRLAKKLGIDSLYVLIEKCKRDIKELEELVYNEERDNM